MTKGLEGFTKMTNGTPFHLWQTISALGHVAIEGNASKVNAVNKDITKENASCKQSARQKEKYTNKDMTKDRMKL